MTLMAQFVILLISLLGILFGYLLAKIAPEELKDGRKYFLLMKKILFVALFLIINYYFLINKSYSYLVTFTILCIILFLIDLKLNLKLKLKLKSQYMEIANYIVFIIPYFLIPQINFQLLIASLMFIYGFPIGTLLKYGRKK